MASSELRAVADELYGLAPASFTAERNRRASAAKEDGDTSTADAVRRLSKPSAAAWAVNMLVRHRSEAMDDLFALGEELRAAQAALDRDEMRRLGQERHEVVSALARDAASLASELGAPIAAGAVRDVEQTLQAAVVDKIAATAVATGRLTRALIATGLEPVDVTDAIGAPPDDLADAANRPAPPARRSRGGRAAPSTDKKERTDKNAPADLSLARVAKAEREAEEAEAAVDEARAAVDELEARIAELTHERERRSDELDELRARIEEIEDDLVDLGRETRATERRRTQALRDLERAERDADRARDRVADLRDGR